MTGLGVLSVLDEVKVCVGYVGEDGARYDHVPYHQSVLHKVKPVYETFPGWRTEIGDAHHRRPAVQCPPSSGSSRSTPAFRSRSSPWVAP